MTWDAQRFEQRKTDFLKSLSALKESLALYLTYEASSPLGKALRDSVVRRFEVSYEMAWKTAKLWLESKDLEVRNANDTWREALKQALIDDGNGWSKLHENRNLTSHTYDETVALGVATFLEVQGIRLLTDLAKRLDTLKAS